MKNALSATSLEALKKKAIARVPKFAKTLYHGFVAMGITWGATTPSEHDITSTLTCLINDLKTIDRADGYMQTSTGRLFARYEIEYGEDVARITFGLEMADEVLKVL